MDEQTSPRWINLAIGAWLFLSAFFWPHTGAQYANSLVVGAVIAIAATIATRVPWFRYVNVAAALWLFVSSWIFPVMSTGTLWNNVIASIVIMLVALQPSHREPAYR